jgi:hypothetical protein
LTRTQIAAAATRPTANHLRRVMADLAGDGLTRGQLYVPGREADGSLLLGGRLTAPRSESCNPTPGSIPPGRCPSIRSFKDTSSGNGHSDHMPSRTAPGHCYPLATCAAQGCKDVHRGSFSLTSGSSPRARQSTASRRRARFRRVKL